MNFEKFILLHCLNTFTENMKAETKTIFLKKRKNMRKRCFLLLAILLQTGNTLLTLMTLTDIYTFTRELLVIQKEEGRFIKERERKK